MQSLSLTEAVEKRLHKAITKNALKESVELQKMAHRAVVEPRASLKPPTEREKSLLLHYDKKAKKTSWVIFGVNILLVIVFSWISVVVNRQKSNNSFQG